jgi:hypothetical protein
MDVGTKMVVRDQGCAPLCGVRHDPHAWAMMTDPAGTFRWCPGFPSLDERIREAVQSARIAPRAKSRAVDRVCIVDLEVSRPRYHAIGTPKLDDHERLVFKTACGKPLTHWSVPSLRVERAEDMGSVPCRSCFPGGLS